MVSNGQQPAHGAYSSGIKLCLSSLSSSTSSTTISDKSLWTSAREHSRGRRLQLRSQPPSHDEGEEDGGEQQEKGNTQTINTSILLFVVLMFPKYQDIG